MTETQWPGRTKIKNGHRILNRVDSHLSLLEKVVLTGAKAILSVYKTTQAIALYRKAYLRSPEIELNFITEMFTVRIAWLDLQHPFITYKTQVLQTKKGNIRFTHLLLSLPWTE